MKRSVWLLGVLASSLAFSGGCQGIAYLGYLIAPEPPPKTVEAEFKDLAGHKTAIVVYMDESTKIEYPYARYHIAHALADELGKNVSKIDLVNVDSVAKYELENLNWQSMDKTRLAQALGADYLLYVSIVEFSTREQGSAYLYRGNLLAQAAVYDGRAPSERQVYYLPHLETRYPEGDSVGTPGVDEARLEMETVRTFAQGLAKKFYKHKVPQT